MTSLGVWGDGREELPRAIWSSLLLGHLLDHLLIAQRWIDPLRQFGAHGGRDRFDHAFGVVAEDRGRESLQVVPEHHVRPDARVRVGRCPTGVVEPRGMSLAGGRLHDEVRRTAVKGLAGLRAPRREREGDGIAVDRGLGQDGLGRLLRVLGERLDDGGRRHTAGPPFVGGVEHEHRGAVEERRVARIARCQRRRLHALVGHDDFAVRGQVAERDRGGRAIALDAHGRAASRKQVAGDVGVARDRGEMLVGRFGRVCHHDERERGKEGEEFAHVLAPPLRPSGKLRFAIPIGIASPRKDDTPS